MPSTAPTLRRLLAGALLAASALLTSACQTMDEEQVTVTIRPGSNLREAAESLSAHGLVRFPELFRQYARVLGRDRSIKFGTYMLARGSSWGDILAALESGRGIFHRVHVIEGWALWDIVPAVADTLRIPQDSVWAAVRDTAQIRRIGAPRGTRDLQGYLFPAVYDFPDGVNARQAVELMLRAFEAAWEPGWDARAAELKMSKHQIVTLASIVEKEVRKGSERPTVSAVYHNRLRIGQMLQADPTIQFALGRRRPARVLYRDLEVQSPYNTYRRRGLPPGPIASPGAASIEAALYPADVTYRYFVAHPDGHHEFRNTYAEHLQAIREVRSEAARRAEQRRREEAAAATAAAAVAGDSALSPP